MMDPGPILLATQAGKACSCAVLCCSCSASYYLAFWGSLFDTVCLFNFWAFLLRPREGAFGGVCAVEVVAGGAIGVESPFV